MSLDADFAANLIIAQDGDVVVVPLLLARRLGLPAAVFLRQAAYLSAIVKKNNGWFFLEQTRPGNPDGDTVFERLGSWQDAFGIGPDAQLSIRKLLKKLELLEENKKGMVHGKLKYKVDSQKYLNFLASLNTNVSPCIVHSGNPDCTSGKSPNVQSKKVGATYTKKKKEVEVKIKEREHSLAEKTDSSFIEMQNQKLLSSSTPTFKQSVDKKTGAFLKVQEDADLLVLLVKRYGEESVKNAAAEAKILTGKGWLSEIAKLLKPKETRGNKLSKGKWSDFDKKDYMKGVGGAEKNFSF